MHNKTGKIHLLDCTLRDGGWVCDFRFGAPAMRRILYGLENAGIDQIELGYLDLAHGSEKERSMYTGFRAFENNGIHLHRNPKAVHIVMIDCGKYPHEEIPPAAEAGGSGVQGIRICFHREGSDEAVRLGRNVLAKGYRLYMQPMVASRYPQQEYIQLLKTIGRELPGTSAVYLVDSFGVMDTGEITERILCMDRELPSETAAGLHIHNNRKHCFENAVNVCSLLGGHRELFIDASLCGMGKGAGNLDTLRFADYLNRVWGGQYDTGLLREMEEQTICPLQEQYQWGPYPEYELTARYSTSPTYANLFFRERGADLDGLEFLLSQLPEEKKDSFDRDFAEAFYKEKMAAGPGRRGKKDDSAEAETEEEQA